MCSFIMSAFHSIGPQASRDEPICLSIRLKYKNEICMCAIIYFAFSKVSNMLYLFDGMFVDRLIT